MHFLRLLQLSSQSRSPKQDWLTHLPRKNIEGPCLLRLSLMTSSHYSTLMFERIITVWLMRVTRRQDPLGLPRLYLVTAQRTVAVKSILLTMMLVQRTAITKKTIPRTMRLKIQSRALPMRLRRRSDRLGLVKPYQDTAPNLDELRLRCKKTAVQSAARTTKNRVNMRTTRTRTRRTRAKRKMGHQSKTLVSTSGRTWKLLSGSLGFDGSFYVSKPAPEAPNPALNLGNLGPIGLPLSEREARVIAASCIQAPFGKGERTVVDKSVRDTWEMDASQVRFDNPAWHTYMDTVTREVCKTLGIKFEVSRPRAELYKLLLYQSGSHFLPHKDTEKAPGMIATIVVVLSSRFTGGEVHVSHGTMSKVLDCSGTSAFQTTVLAWYTDVTHEVKPITSGYRIALAYNLMHTTAARRPALPSSEAKLDQLMHILRSWKHSQKVGASNTPAKLLYLLKHEYGKADLSADALKGSDAHLLSMLNHSAHGLGFHIGLASVECHVTGVPDDDGDYYSRKYGHYDDRDPDEMEMIEVIDQEMSITDVVDLDGTKIRNEIECDDSETIPSDLRKKVESGNPDDQEYEGYMGNGAGSLERWYRRTVFVIWPESSHFQIAYGDGNDAYALTTLSGITSSTRPSRKDKKFVQWVIRTLSPRSPVEVARAVSSIACRWEDFTLWKQAVQACGADKSVNMLTAPRIMKAIDTFGIDQLKTTLEVMLANDPGNQSRYDLIRQIRLRLGDTRPPDYLFIAWVTEQYEHFVQSLKAPAVGEGPMLIQLALENGGLAFLNDTILPQMKAVADAGFLRTFALSVKSQEDGFRSSTSLISLDDLVQDILSSAIEKVDFYAVSPQKPVQTSTYMSYYNRAPAPQPLPTPELAELYVLTCIKAQSDNLLERLFQRLLEQPPAAPEAHLQQRAATVLLPLVARMRNALGTSRNIVVAAFHLADFCRGVLEYWSKHQAHSQAPHLESLVEAALLSGEFTLLSSLIVPKLKVLQLPEASMRRFVEEVHNRRGEFASAQGAEASLSPLTTDLVDYIIGKAVMVSPASAIEYLDFCLNTGNPASCVRVIMRLLNPGVTVSDAYIKQSLVPFIPELRRFLIRHKLSPTTEPFSSAFKAIMTAWLNKFLGPKPSEARMEQIIASVRRLDCSCLDCRSVVKFLGNRDSTQSVLTLSRIGAPKRRHVEQYLGRYCSLAATWALVSGSPQGLRVQKTDCLLGPAAWRASQTEAKIVLNSISTSGEELKTIFGADYDALLRRINGTTVPATVPLTTATAHQSQSDREDRLPSAVASTKTLLTRPPWTGTQGGPSTAPPTRPFSLPSKKRKPPIDESDIIDLTSP
ncbi:hypothetical protein OE88DRAFT_876433 [Heliocybe sulcata]|uniref:Prolyl 4-hydroxylase alpha subunit Fe(2+) 2OG dioxygenase domain-containing protein n=1 Tax=Heliocybe sulcata TaxID=5364 RepID=A0A5C3MP12_9AGAM|nr:hypothetical protein OE88DRAFT_876433 [Heliocybe sulcata]